MAKAGIELLTINLNDYVSDIRIQEIAEEELRYAFRRQVQKETDIERVLSNLSYEYIFRVIQNELGRYKDVFLEQLKDKARKVIADEETLRYEIFRRADAWGKTESVAVKWLDEVLEGCKPKIEEEVNKRIEEYPFYELTDRIQDTIYETIENVLFNRRGDK